MRYIRDIIKDKKNGAIDAPATSRTPKPSADFSKPLLLVEPMFPDKESDDTNVEAAVLEQNYHEPAQVVATDTTPDVPSETEDRAEAKLPPAAEMDDAIDAESNTLELEPHDSEADPFDKLRNAEPVQSNKPTSVSPLRNSQKPSTAIDDNKDETVPAADATDPAETEELTPLVDALAPDKMQMPAPAMGRGSKISGRVKTRLLGFSAEAFNVDDPFKTAAPASNDFPVGWLVVVSEKGRGKSFPLRDGVSSVGRGSDQTVCLDIGDNSISRENHISIAFDAEQKKFFVGHGGKTNLVRLNNAPLLSTEEMRSKDTIRLGETTLRFMAFCDEDFSWEDQNKQTAQRA